ncbi:hypothetical protein MMB232_00682 [Brevundimonas subvibrioides]|uniref:hypothetical protein n=1 Tax=Brevundimonas subvibrioides TaxID=74313 RepID=UPI0032D580BB
MTSRSPDGAATGEDVDRLSRRERLRLRLSTLAWFFLLAGMGLSLPVLLDIGWWAPPALALISIAAAAPIAWVLRRVLRGAGRDRWRTVWLKAATILFSTLSVLAAAPIYYLAINSALRPMTVPLATLSDGRKTVVFQGMTHVGSESFYKSVVYDLEQALTQGYVIFYEGVQDDPEGDAWFARTMAGGGDLSATYAAFGRACGLQFQLDYFTLLDADKAEHPERHVAADVSTADMKREYERLVRTDPAFAAFARDRDAVAADAQDSASARLARVFGWLDHTTPGQKALIGAACRGIMNRQLASGEGDTPINAVVLDFRNRALARRIVESPSDRIYVTYGAGHLPGLLEAFKALDPAWEVKSVKWARTIAPPENLKGHLP